MNIFDMIECIYFQLTDMVKNIIYMVFGLLAFLCTAQERVESIDMPFTKVKVSSGIIATIHLNSDVEKVVISGIDKDEVDVRLRRDELRISLPLNHLFSNSDTQVDVYIKSVEGIEATSSAQLIVNGVVKQNEMFFKAVELASITAKLEVDQLNLYLLTGGIITLTGKAEQQNIILKTGSEYYGENLITKVTNIEVSYKGIAVVHAKETCVASVIAGGEVSVYGEPKKFEESTKLGGLIKKVIVNN